MINLDGKIGERGERNPKDWYDFGLKTEDGFDDDLCCLDVKYVCEWTTTNNDSFLSFMLFVSSTKSVFKTKWIEESLPLNYHNFKL